LISSEYNGSDSLSISSNLGQSKGRSSQHLKLSTFKDSNNSVKNRFGNKGSIQRLDSEIQGGATQRPQSQEEELIIELNEKGKTGFCNNLKYLFKFRPHS
jgi:hypothetical protein